MGCACVLMVGAGELAARMAVDRRDQAETECADTPPRERLDGNEPDLSDEEQPSSA
jgi:hypothetical protein